MSEQRPPREEGASEQPVDALGLPITPRERPLPRQSPRQPAPMGGLPPAGYPGETPEPQRQPDNVYAFPGPLPPPPDTGYNPYVPPAGSGPALSRTPAQTMTPTMAPAMPQTMTPPGDIPPYAPNDPLAPQPSHHPDGGPYGRQPGPPSATPPPPDNPGPPPPVNGDGSLPPEVAPYPGVPAEPVRAPEAGGEVAALAEQFAQRFALLVANIERIIKGRREAVELALVCLFSEGHLLIEDVPGTGKSTLARCIAASVDGTLRHIRFTPDLPPPDGESPPPATVVLADDIDRAAPRARAALLAAMEERRDTPRPSMVIATQAVGAVALGESDLDRFLMRISLGYPDRAVEAGLLKTMPIGPAIDRLPMVARVSDIAGMIDFATRIHAPDPICDYVVAVVAATRNSRETRLGASPRAALALLRACRVRAAAAGRPYVTPEDVQALAVPVLAHRLALTPRPDPHDQAAAILVREIVTALPAPGPFAGV